MADKNSDTAGVLDVVFTWRRLMYRLLIAAVVVSVAVSLVLPKWYSAHSTLIPPSGSEAEFGFMQLSSAMGIDLGGMGLMSETPSLDLMLGVLKSRRLREPLVDRFGLEDVYRSRTREHAIKALADHITIKTTPEGLIQVEVEDRDKQRAADMANALVELLDQFNRETSVEQARRTSEFILGYLDDNDVRLVEAADSLQSFQRAHGAIELTEQTRATVLVASELQAERMRLDIQKGVLSNFASSDQHKMLDIQATIDEIDERLRNIMEGGGDGSSAAHGVLLALGDVPGLGFELARLTRDVMVRERVQSFLIAEYEQSRIQEAKDLQSIQVVDLAVPPLRKARPRRSLVVLLTVALAGIAGVGLAFACDGILAKEGEWVEDGLASSSEVGLLLRFAHRIARFGGVE